MSLFKMTDISCSYGSALVVKKIHLEIEKGQMVGIIGPNGAGKSTLLNSITGLKNYSGNVVFKGESVKDLDPHEIVKKGISYCPEERCLFPNFSVKDNLKTSAPLFDGKFEDRLDEIYSIFPILGERENQLAKSLSGGERQMLALGRALVPDPDMLLIDEPSQGLAPTIIEQLSAFFEDMKGGGKGILLAEQNVEFAIELTDYLYLLEKGEVVKEGTSEEMREDEYIHKSYLGFS